MACRSSPAWGRARNSFQFSGLSLYTAYFVAIQAYDVAGNASTNVTTLRIFLPSTDPPGGCRGHPANPGWPRPPPPSRGAVTTRPTCSASPVSRLLTANFTTWLVGPPTVPGLSACFRLSGRNRANNYYFAVVGFNGTNGFILMLPLPPGTDQYVWYAYCHSYLAARAKAWLKHLPLHAGVDNATLTIQPEPPCPPARARPSSKAAGGRRDGARAHHP